MQRRSTRIASNTSILKLIIVKLQPQKYKIIVGAQVELNEKQCIVNVSYPLYQVRNMTETIDLVIATFFHSIVGYINTGYCLECSHNHKFVIFPSKKCVITK